MKFDTYFMNNEEFDKSNIQQLYNLLSLAKVKVYYNVLAWLLKNDIV